MKEKIKIHVKTKTEFHSLEIIQNSRGNYATGLLSRKAILQQCTLLIIALSYIVFFFLVMFFRYFS